MDQPGRLAKHKHVNQCAGGGFVKLQEILLCEEEPKCELCQSLLSGSGYKVDGFKQAVEKAKGGDPLTLIETVPPPEELQQSWKRPKVEGGKKKKRSKDAVDAIVDDFRIFTFEDCLEVAKEFAPYMKLLKPGSHDKKLPYHCAVCVSKRQPEGKIGECAQMKPYAVRYFMKKHWESPTHQSNLKLKLGGDVEEVERERGFLAKQSR